MVLDPHPRAEAQDESAAGEVLEVPGCLGDHHRGAGEGHRYGCAVFYLFCDLGGYGERQERVVSRLAGLEAGEA